MAIACRPCHDQHSANPSHSRSTHLPPPPATAWPCAHNPRALLPSLSPHFLSGPLHGRSAADGGATRGGAEHCAAPAGHLRHAAQAAV